MIAACIHSAIVAKVLKTGADVRCDENGKFRLIQCDARGCYCVDTDDGTELLNTRVAIGETPKCDGK
ncbi:unnamed protein product [Anisakis simplex]|uniref:Thyroglobulin type-1 domain-containing protein n=1 Tax=Anisakis simplex TaxID=6269 RepID=A0A0M3JHQ5_ANISI|nr:unnamed protein product [Anisakis simplex]